MTADICYLCDVYSYFDLLSLHKEFNVACTPDTSNSLALRLQSSWSGGLPASHASVAELVVEQPGLS